MLHTRTFPNHTLLAFVLACWLTTSQSAPRAIGAEVDFSQQIQPILAKHCAACHGPDTAESGLSFSDREAALVETESGEHAIVPGDIDASMLIARITTQDEFERMPPEGDALSDEEIEILKAWIKEGAVWSDHWSFVPMQQRQPPAVADERWSENPIDAFIYHRLADAKLRPNPQASKRQLIRRAYFDLTGLPPTQAEVQQFLDDASPDAFAKLVDRLLESPHYGERWGRHYLDLVRYAETNSFERDGVKENAWKYRDYVIRSLNDDKPYNQFIREQLAGDELDHVTTETLTATGFYRLGIWDDEPVDAEQARFDGLDDIIMTTGQAFLGLTMNCARCHDHKIDPIPQADYYSMLSFLEDLTPHGRRGDPHGFNQIDVSSPDLNRRYEENEKERQEIERSMTEIEQAGIVKMPAPDQRATEGPKRERNRVLKEKLRDHLSDEQWTQYQDLKKRLQENEKVAKELPPRERVMGLAAYRPIDKPTFVLFRGNPGSPADEVTPSFPSIYGQAAPEIPEPKNAAQPSGRRRILADWIASDDNRLTARVAVNRIWQFHFGRGIVRSSNNFGKLGTPPTHPDLLDYLALRFIDDGWKLKSMHRLIMNSQAYQLSSTSENEHAAAADPDNNLFWRFDPRRLSSEEVRDSMLAVNGSLNRTTYGASFYPSLSAEVLAGQSRPGEGWGNSSEEEQNRRSVYIHVKRSLITPLMSAFDFPDPDSTCEARFMTLQPAQALSLLNSDDVHEQGRRLADVIDAVQCEDAEVVRRTVRRVLAREATEKEIAEGQKLIDRLQNHYKLPRQRAVQLYCVSVMNWNEFLFVD
ncbi:PSD1 and planctomycete cytochrome C domain-containing protein [Stieleria varia]|uniref:Planctomycete cytochrome C n=1 Tax=Stieleria varia TaxID=2528005 RepID=A0A5C6AY88_9BACT|nr:PSD1 and planctomycete cytochrome C domain-containing protein [Stieleria varia]TWU04680.1 Planctomycete cytochrome C [Stieleria varia]